MPSAVDDLQRVLDAAVPCAAATTWSDVATLVLPAVAELVRADGAVFHEADPALTQQLDIWSAGAEPPLAVMSGYAAVMPRHPFVTHLPQLSAVPAARLSDLVAPGTWRASPVHRDCLRHLGIDDQVALVLTAPPHAVRLVTAHRAGRPFTEHEERSLALLGPHLRATFDRLVRCGGPRLVLRTVPDLRWVEDVLAPAPPAGLTPREQEVLTLLAAGCSSAQVAHRLGCSPRTVDKHAQNLSAKLGTASRWEAVSRWRTSGGQVPAR
ncbi:helix-turn-helix transcriptional regulator [Kineococcus terrestris]|uniref:helix-turn-helix transcriptional regulator n=1 Tax=Kineococcus terrestris TaxID=2044856 RepID=UPI0034DABD92